HRSDLGLDATSLARVKQRCAEDGLCVLGLRFSEDKSAPAERFQRLRRELGDAFVAVELDSSPGNPNGFSPRSHCVLTAHFLDEPSSPSWGALDQVLEFLRTRLLSETA